MESADCKEFVGKLPEQTMRTSENAQESKTKATLKLAEVQIILNAKIICGHDKLEKEVGYAFASDLMSDVLTLDSGNLMLLTGLANLQAIRTAEMSDISTIVFVRCKKVSEEMITLAKENGMVLMEADITMFHASGLLFKAGIKPVF